MLRLLRFIGIDMFFNQITLYHRVTQGDNSKIQNAVFSKRNHGTGNLRKDFFQGHLQPPVD